MGAFSALGILLLQFLVSIAVIVFFWREDRSVSLWSRLIAPGLSTIGLATCFGLMPANLEWVSGSSSRIVQSFPWILAFVAVLGASLALWVKARRPAVYAALGRPFS